MVRNRTHGSGRRKVLRDSSRPGMVELSYLETAQGHLKNQRDEKWLEADLFSLNRFIFFLFYHSLTKAKNERHEIVSLEAESLSQKVSKKRLRIGGTSGNSSGTLQQRLRLEMFCFFILHLLLSTYWQFTRRFSNHLCTSKLSRGDCVLTRRWTSIAMLS